MTQLNTDHSGQNVEFVIRFGVVHQIVRIGGVHAILVMDDNTRRHGGCRSKISELDQSQKAERSTSTIKKSHHLRELAA